ncbi:MAG: L-threonylcarbamoyladenylate synthase [Microcoleaceae cyanobacterium]
MAKVFLDTLIAAARSGSHVVSFPTDTVPALAVRPDRADDLFAVKQRPADKSLVLMGANSADLWPFTQGSPADRQVWQQVTQQFWPGALTLVLPASELVPLVMHPTDPTTIGLRVPNCAIAREILTQTGPLATTSANLSGQPPLVTLAEIAMQFPEIFTLESSTLDLNVPMSRIPSTVVKWQVNIGWEILRQGAVKLQFKE